MSNCVTSCIPWGVEITVARGTSPLFVVRYPRPEGGEHKGVLLLGHRLAAEAASGEVGQHLPAGAPEPGHYPGGVPPGKARLDDQPGRVAWVASSVQEHARAAQRMSKHDRVRDAHRVAEHPDVIGATLEGPRRRIAPLAAPVPAQVQVHNLGDGGELIERRLEVRMVEGARTAVHQHYGGPHPHVTAAGHQAGAIHVEPEPAPVHVDMHPPTSSPWVEGQTSPGQGVGRYRIGDGTAECEASMP